MMFRQLIKSLIPPFFLQVLKGGTKKTPTKLYNTYEEALKDCANEEGYEDDDIVKVVLKKTMIYKEQIEGSPYLHISHTDANALTAIQLAIKADHLTVLDFGGACGAHYFTFRKVLGDKVKLKWIVVETPKMVSFAKTLENDELSFFDSLESAIAANGDIDLLFSSGTIQSVPDPKKTLTQFINLGVKNIFLGRLSISTGLGELITIQKSWLSSNGIGSLPAGFTDRSIEYPHTSIMKSDLEEILSLGYSINLRLDDNSGIHQVNGEPIIGYGVLLEKI